MQSFIQYRKFRKQVERQHGRHAQLEQYREGDATRASYQEPYVPSTSGPPEAPIEEKSEMPMTSSSSSMSPDHPEDRRIESKISLPSDTTSSASSIADQEVPDLEKADSSAGAGLERHNADFAAQSENKLEEEAEELHDDLKSRGHRSTADTHLNMSRITTAATSKSNRTALGRALTGIHVRDRKTNEGKGGQVFVVGYEGEQDPLNPHNWPYSTRIFATMLIAGVGFVVGFASAIDASALKKASAEFGVSEVAESLATGIYLIGFGAGALFAGPVSETLGRNPVYIATMSIYMIFVMASALAPNLGGQLAFRFLAGFFGSTPLTCAGGSISDLWSPMERVFAFPVFANAAFTGPVLGPVLGGFIAQSDSVSWRWVEWTTLIMSGLVFFGVVFFQPETYPPVLLQWKAKHLRDLTGDKRYVSEHEIKGESFFIRLKRALYRPFILTATEPVIMLLALYLTVIYIILFTFLDGYDYIFGEIHGTSQGITGLCFLGIAIGLFGASALVPLIYKWAKRDLAKIKEQGGDRLPPEFRLWFAMLGGAPAIPISMFWMGWTSYSDISLWSPLGASVLFGYGILCVFISSYQYIIDSYESYAASALASVTLIRYMAAGGMVVVGVPFYENMGVHWTLTILGGISVLLVPVPYLFYRYGRKIRSWSRFAIDRD